MASATSASAAVASEGVRMAAQSMYRAYNPTTGDTKKWKTGDQRVWLA